MRLAILSVIAKMLRIQFKVNGLPYGAANRTCGCCGPYGKNPPA